MGPRVPSLRQTPPIPAYVISIPPVATIGSTRAMTYILSPAFGRKAPALLLSLLLFTAFLIVSPAPEANAAVPLLDIAYSSGGNIWLQRADGTKTQLTWNASQIGRLYIPEVSPDGLYIAFAAEVAGTNNQAIWIMDIDGSHRRQITSVDAAISTTTVLHDLYPRWSPDGASISFERDGTLSTSTGNFVSSTADIFSVNVSTGAETPITTNHHASGPAAWAPDSHRLVYWKTDSIGFSVVAADGSGEHQLSSQSPKYPFRPEWSHDGRTIYFDTDSVTGIWYFTSATQFTSTIDTAAADLISTNGHSARLTPDGKSLGFISSGVIYTYSFADGTQLPQPITGVIGFSFIPPKATDCAPVMFVGVRGSGETATDSNGYGSTVDSVRQRLTSYFPGMNSRPVNYTAVRIEYGKLLGSYGSDYVLSLNDGITSLKGDLADIFKSCPTAKIVIAGYSQGAQVAGDVYGSLNDVQKSQVAALLMFGDARFNPKDGQQKVDTGTYKPAFSGIYQFIDPKLRVIDKPSEQHVASVCLRYDPICNYAAPYAISCATTFEVQNCPHQLYAFFGWTTRGADWAACMVTASPKRQDKCNRP